MTRKTYPRMLERRCGSYFIRFMDRIHEVHVIEEPPSRMCVSRERLTKIRLTNRPDYVWPEIWIGMSKGAQKEEKQGWSTEKPKLDNARTLRGIYFIDSEDEEYEETIKNARKKLEVPMEAAMHCKMEIRKRARKPQETVASGSTDPNKKTEYACIVEAHESTRNRLETTLPRNQEDHTTDAGLTIIFNVFFQHMHLGTYVLFW